MEPLNWAELQAKEDYVFDWLREMGLDQHHRLKVHRQNIDEILQAEQAGRYEEFRDQLSEDDKWARLWSICESIEFVEAMKPLAESRPGGIRHVLRRALDGPVDLLEESEDNSRGRNATFEVVVGGLLAHAGLRVEFRENPDVFTAYADRPVVIQCKRPFKPESVSRNLFKAGRQLRKDLRQHHDGLAVIAMSFSRLFNAGNKLARFSTEDEMDTKLHVDLRRAADNLDGTLDQIKRFGVSAVFFHSATPAFIEANPGMVFRQVGAMIPVAANKNEISLLQGLSKLIKM